MQQLDATVDKVRHFFEENSITYFRPIFKGSNVTIAFEIPVKSFIAQGELRDNFSFELTLSEKNGQIIDKIATIKNTNVPFHPNFAVKPAWGATYFRGIPYGLWKGHDPDEKEIDLRLKRMILSLQFHQGYIEVEGKSFIGNKRALNWYLKEHHSNPTVFPTDHFLKKNFQASPVRSSVEKKKFEVVSGETDAKKKFTVQKETSFSPEIKPMHERTTVESLNSLIERKQSSSIVYLSSLAKDQIFKHIKWGNEYAAESKSEQGGLLLGKVYRDQSRNVIYAVVEQAIPGESAYGTATHLEMSHQTWSEMINKVDHLLKFEETKDLQIVGWYHTHPNHLDVFMSGTDLNTQRKYFNKDWHFAIVLNPQKRIWKAFSGANAQECSGFVVSDGSAQSAAMRTEDRFHRPVSTQRDELSVNDQDTLVTSTFDSKSAKILTRPILFFVLLISAFAIWSRSGDNPRANDAADNKERSASRLAQGGSVPPATEVTEETPTTQPGSSLIKSKIALEKGTILYNEQLRQLFKEPLPHSIKGYGTPVSDGNSKIEVDLFAHSSVVRFTPDSALKLFENLRANATTDDNSLVGKLIDTLLVEKKNYTRQGNWYKITLTVVAQQ